MLGVAEVWVGTSRVVKIMDDSTDQQSCYLNSLQHLLRRAVRNDSQVPDDKRSSFYIHALTP